MNVLTLSMHTKLKLQINKLKNDVQENINCFNILKQAMKVTGAKLQSSQEAMSSIKQYSSSVNCCRTSDITRRIFDWQSNTNCEIYDSLSEPLLLNRKLTLMTGYYLIKKLFYFDNLPPAGVKH